MDLELTYIRRPDGGRTLTIPDERRAQAIAFVRESASKGPAAIEALIEEGHSALLREIDGMSEPQASYRPAADEWSVLELMAHVVTAKQIVAALSASLAKGTLPPGFSEALEVESAQDGVTVTRFETLDAARAAAGVAHAALLDSIRGAGGDANTEMTFKHFVFGAMNCREWAAFQRLHDDDHRPQIGAIRASAGFPAA